MAGRLQARHIFLTGQPSIGKTTLACAAVRDVPACGFYTAERRSADGARQGFDVVVLGSAETGPLASLGRGSAMVGKYAVDVESFERLALPSLQANDAPITLIDEVGKMELFSPLFLPLVEAILDGASTVVLGTLPMPRYGHTIEAVERIRARPDVAVVKLLKANRDDAARAVSTVIRTAATRQRPGEPFDVSQLAAFLQEGQAEKLRSAPAATKPPPSMASGVAVARAAALPLIGEAPRVLLLGETASAAPGPGELPYAERSMWPVLRLALELPDGTPLAQTQAAALASGVAVWDVLADVHQPGRRKRGGAADAERHNDIAGLLEARPSIQLIAFIGAKARAAFERHCGSAAAAATLVVLPSSSRANTQPIASKAVEWRRVLFK